MIKYNDLLDDGLRDIFVQLPALQGGYLWSISCYESTDRYGMVIKAGGKEEDYSSISIIYISSMTE